MARRFGVALLCIGSTLLGCTEPLAVEDVAGSYEATQFVEAVGSAWRDVLLAGGSLELTLEPGGTTSGRLLVPDEAGVDTDLEVDLSGTWSLAHSVIRLSTDEDVFLRAMRFVREDGRLVGSRVDLGTPYGIELERRIDPPAAGRP